MVLKGDSRQRILTTLSHKQPDRCVTYIWIDNDAMKRLMQYMKLSSSEEVKEELGIDKWIGVGAKIKKPDDYQERINSLVPQKM